MEQKLYLQKLLELKQSGALQKRDLVHAHDRFIPFEGTPKKHPVDNNILVLCSNPFETHKKYYEFTLDSVEDIEELDSVSSDKGETAYRVRVWVSKGTLAFQTEPFIVK